MINLGEYMLNVKNKVFLIIPLSLLYFPIFNSKYVYIFDSDLFLYTRNFKNERLKPGFVYKLQFEIVF